MTDLLNGADTLPPRRELRDRVNVNGWRAVAALALLLAAGSMLLSVVLYARGDDQDREIQRSRVELTRRSCERTNQERAILRRDVRRSIETIARTSDEVLGQFGLTRAEALARERADLAALAPLDCDRLVAEVRKVR